MTFKVPKVPTIFLSHKACYIKKSVQVTFSCFFKFAQAGGGAHSGHSHIKMRKFQIYFSQKTILPAPATWNDSRI